MKIILLSDVASLGKKDDVVEVSAGYARNSLIPKHLGEEATPANMNNLKLRKKHEAKIERENLEKALELKKKIEDWKVEVSIKTGEGGRVFGSVSTKEIAEAAEKQYGVKIDKKKLECDVPVKAPGGYDVNVRLHRDVTAVMHVHVSGTN